MITVLVEWIILNLEPEWNGKLTSLWAQSGLLLEFMVILFLEATTLFEQKSLPNIVRSPYNNRLKSLSQSESIGSSHLLPLGSREQDKDSFIMDLDPVDEENDEC